MWLLLDKKISNIFNFSEQKKYTYLVDLSRVNILVGKNNSGKSYFMRNLLKHSIKILGRDEIKKMLLNESNFQKSETVQLFDKCSMLSQINNKYIKALKQIKTFEESKYAPISMVFSSGSMYYFKNFDNLISNSRELFSYLNISGNVTAQIINDKIINDKDNLIKRIADDYKTEFKKIFEKISDDLLYQFGELLYDLGYVKECLQSYNNSYNNKDKNVIEESFKYYIPLLRSIRHPLKDPHVINAENTKDIFKERIIKEYEYNENEVNVITGLDFYREYKIKLLGSKHERELVSDFEKFLSNYFFEGKDISIIPDEKTYELKININDSDDRFIYEVGDGITSLIIIMYNIFINENTKRKIYFIEEPEQSFHPGFQRLLMNIISLNPKFNNCYFFFTTHSNHLIDIGNFEFRNVTNYLCRKNNDSIEIAVQNEDMMDSIQELGVNPSSIQISNKLIWVEGKYDAFYIRLLLNKKNINKDDRKYIEEYDYSFIPYGGSNGTLINFSINNSEEINKEFILRASKVNPNFLIIMDDDGISTGTSSNNKKVRYDKLKESLGSRLYKLNVREIENLFPVDVIKKFFVQGLKDTLGSDLKFLDDIKYSDYKNKKLGEYLNKLVKQNIGDDLKLITGREFGFVANGFLYNKSKFHECVIDWINRREFDYDVEIPIETKELINTVEKFISG